MPGARGWLPFLLRLSLRPSLLISHRSGLIPQARKQRQISGAAGFDQRTAGGSRAAAAAAAAAAGGREDTRRPVRGREARDGNSNSNRPTASESRHK
uniref:Secreted protein n=1 Tax=Zea mays TaxID=4577 RepID=B8A3D5_MAIZE|nr:unknown [Zea mays]